MFKKRLSIKAELSVAMVSFLFCSCLGNITFADGFSYVLDRSDEGKMMILTLESPDLSIDSNRFIVVSKKFSTGSSIQFRLTLENISKVIADHDDMLRAISMIQTMGGGKFILSDDSVAHIEEVILNPDEICAMELQGEVIAGDEL